MFMKKDKPEITKLLSSNVRRHRMDKKYTQELLAEKIGISVRHLSDIERADSFPSPEVIERLSDVFGLSSSYMLFLPSEEERIETLLSSSLKEKLDNEIRLAIRRTIDDMSLSTDKK